MSIQANLFYKNVSPLDKYNINFLYHMTHIANLDSILKYGLLAHNNPYKQQDISNKQVNSRRSHRETIYYRKVHDYVPFYFNPRNAMLYRNLQKYGDDIIILKFRRELLLQKDTIFTNKNASTDSVKYFNNFKDLDKLNWKYIWSSSWYDRILGINDEIIKKTMMAEVLVYNRVSIDYLEGIVCKSKEMKLKLEEKYQNIDIYVNKSLFF